MNLILFEEQLDHYSLPKGDERFDHVRGVLRMGVGDTFMVGVVNGPRGDARITDISEKEMQVSVTWDADAMLPPPAIHLVLAIPRPATARKVLFDATTLGVHSFHFFTAEKSDPAYNKSSLWTELKWRSQVLKGAEQAFSTHLPNVTVSNSLDASLEQIDRDSTKAALDVYEGSAPYSAATLSLPTTLAIGGERGWSATERETLRKNNFSLYTLGERVLRVETAVTTALALTLAKLGHL